MSSVATPWELPEGWDWAEFQQVARVASNLVDPAAFQESPHIAPNHIESGTGNMLNYTTVAEDKVRSAKHRFLPGHILYSKIRPYLCKAVVVDFEGLCSADMYPIESFINTNYLHRWMVSAAFTEMASNHDGRTLLPKINQEALALLSVPVPPLAEQRRIVSAVERLLVPVTSARERLGRVPTTLKRFRQAILAAACTGRLTAEWREANHADAISGLPAYVPASGMDDVPELPEYPEHWRVTSVGACSELVQYGTSEKADPTGVVPLLRMGNIQDGHIVLDDLKFVNEELPGLSSLLLKRGDMLFNRTNSPELVGKSGVFESEERATFASYLIRVRCKVGSVDSRLLCWWLNSPWGREWAAKVRTDGVSQSNINGTKLQQMPIGVPPLAEQEEIMRRGTALLALADAIEQKAASARRRVELLTQTILAKAFRGELVPTEAELARNEGRSYEAASELLAELQASANGDAKRPRSKKSPKRSTASGENLLEFTDGS
ncbi:restriction endonuclease subunit S [Tautonia sociabilis]|uniref:Type I restriction modification DNA specificity domain-containing protein n=1 Tax=Tautonia sociabilis TaxID=2080755 RepID=A0A432MF17_9BACT|nr:restriction endonuclease subunit S [Tautonia sociabilis]RUL84355.1 hypothetical protein TsocGM_20295 [Tautonia sociabilis]